MASQPARLYRSILRELRLGDKIHKYRAHRTQSSVLQHLKPRFQQLLANEQGESRQSNAQEVESQSAALRELVELGRYLQAKRLHATLLTRYNAGIDMTQEERSRLTARRVGLNMPEEYVSTTSTTQKAGSGI